MRWTRVPAVLAVLILAGCGGGESPRTPPVRQAALLPRTSEPVEDPAERRERFCRTLARIIDAEPTGFAALRAPQAGGQGWDGVVVPPGLDACRVDGNAGAGPSYVCHGQAVAGDAADLLEGSYRDLAGEIDACLAEPIWYPHNWQRGQDFAFAAGERQTVWRDNSSAASSSVALKVEEDLARRLFHLRLAVAPAR
jgi:hypothetical protein